MLKSLFGATSIDEVEVFTENSWAKCCPELKRGSKKVRDRFESKFRELKRKLHPATTDSAVVAMLDEFHSDSVSGEDKKNLGIAIANAQRMINEGPKAKQFSKVFGRIDQDFAKLRKEDMSNVGKSNRAKRSKNAQSLFSRHAGILVPDGARLDKHGNPAGAQYDLGMPGAFDGLKIVVLRQYYFDFSMVRKALEKKGFSVVLYDQLPALKVLKRELKDANQFWLIGCHRAILPQKHIDVILNNWGCGMGMYIFGDNDPLFVDTNVLLKAMKMPVMEGNYYANKHLKPFKMSTCKGFIPHLITTGLSRLFEGDTIAEFDPTSVYDAGCVPIMFNSRRGISVILREAKNGFGQVIADGAFTKLYCKFDHCGSDRFVRNCACYLAADLGSDRVLIPQYGERTSGAEVKSHSKLAPVVVGVRDLEPIEHSDVKIELQLENALIGECDVLCDDAVLSVMATKISDFEQNTTDFALDDPFACADRNMILGHQAYGLEFAKSMLESGIDPYRCTDAFAVIPCVSLEHWQNRKLMTEALCELFMAGKQLPTAAWMIFYGVCDEMSLLGENTEHPEVWKYLKDNILHHITSTPSLADTGQHMPLINAMETFATATDEMEQLTKVFKTVCLISRALFTHEKADADQLLIWLRHSLVKHVVSAVMKLSKNEIQNTENDDATKTKKWYDSHFESLFYTTKYNICIMGTSHTLSVENCLGFLPDWKVVEKSLRNVCEVLKIENVMTDNQITALLFYLHQTSANELAGFRPDDFIQDSLFNSLFKQVWNGEPIPDIIDLLEARFEPFYKGDEVEWKGYFPPFVTCFGPSVYVECGGKYIFGDYKQYPTPEFVENLKRKRNRHFRMLFKSESEMGYPTSTSWHFSLHRSVQEVMISPEYKDSTMLNYGHLQAVADLLLKKNKGFIYFREIGGYIAACIRSYLACRRKGMAEPESLGDGTIKFIDKVKIERGARLSGLVDDTMLVSDPVFFA
eukprot:TRINITY_DN90587_c0_g1_i2.p1 TRINITY_DN90587_c0_g1~~TRINITY_DN90587_c0_g1_i2.p1  ORF type:complete len:977 (-),score=299.99 TRINITY_DN90587_c0_g1_i2:129-3059(-)